MKVPKETLGGFVRIFDILCRFAMQVALQMQKLYAFIPSLMQQIMVDNEPLEYVHNFTYLGSLIRKDNATQNKHASKALKS